MTVQAPAFLDPLLMPFMAAQTEEAASDALGVVLDTHALPVVRGVVRRELSWDAGRGASDADLDDVVSAVIVRLTACLLRARREPDAVEPIANLRAYAGQMATNECADWMRGRFPLRARLTAQVRYACRHHEELALWPWREREWLCGFAIWRDVRDPVEAHVLAALRGRVAVPLSVVATEAKRIVAALLAVLREAGGPCRVSQTVTLIADVLGIDEGAARPLRVSGRVNGDGDGGDGAAAGAGLRPGTRSGWRATARAVSEDVAALRAATREAIDDRHAEHQREFLARVWGEVRQLPIAQRVALLLNLRDEGHADALELLTTAAVATHDELSTCVGMSPLELTTLLPELPKDDEWIARRLGMTRRQVINLRKCARERLARRLGFARRARRTGEAP